MSSNFASSFEIPDATNMYGAAGVRDDVSKHAVQFFETDEFLAASVATFVRDGFERGEPAVVIATATHRERIVAHLLAMAVDVPQLLAEGRFVMLDAGATLDLFVVDDAPDPVRFESVIGGVLQALLQVSDGHQIRAYGEMVDILWRAGRREATLQLEQLWNALQPKLEFSLLCGYRLDSFYEEHGLPDVCATHSRVLPPEPFRARDAARPLVIENVQSLVAEIARRTEVEEELRASVERLRVAEQAARERKEDLEDFLDNAVIAIHRVDRDGVIRWANRAELDLLGYAANEYVGRRISEFHVDQPVIDDLLARLVRGETIHDYEARVRAKDGSIRHLAISSNGQRRNGEFVSTRCFSRDVTALKHAEVAREEASRAKDQFLAMLGHELRNPLSPILTAVQLMRIRGETSSAREQNVIERQVNHLIHLVDDLLDISRITRGKLELERRAVKLSAVVVKALEIVAPLCEEHRHRVSASFPERDVWVDADETRLCQVFTNLLVNAAKFTPDGGTIDVRVECTGERARISVKDSGVGMTSEQLPKIFELFYQGSRVTDRSRGGLGLGLALVHNLVALHGGFVEARSEGAGRGSEMVVQLPAIERGTGTPSLGHDHGIRSRVAVTSRRILVVDDNEDAGELLGELLRSVGHEVVVAIDGPHALEALADFHPEVAILDLGLPVMDGYELARVIRERLGESIRIMAVTGFGQERDRALTAQAGFEAHFVKPIGLAKVLAAIETARTS